MPKDFEIRIDRSGLDKLERDLQAGWPALKIPQDGSEGAAMASVRRQFRAMGITSTHAEVRKIVRENRPVAE